jgi:hypothetical protein
MLSVTQQIYTRKSGELPAAHMADANPRAGGLGSRGEVIRDDFKPVLIGDSQIR